jgi:hypothetical protein
MRTERAELPLTLAPGEYGWSVVLHDELGRVADGDTGGAGSFVVPAAAQAPPAVAWFAEPNPFRDSVRLGGPAADAAREIVILDSAGRVVRRHRLAGPEASTWDWDGRDAGGRPVASGIYFARIVEAERPAAMVKLVRG